MQSFWFEVTKTKDGLPVKGSFDSGSSYTPSLNTAAKLVSMPFHDEKTALKHEAVDGDGYRSAVWQEHCTYPLGGWNMNVHYIGPCEFDSGGKLIRPSYESHSQAGAEEVSELETVEFKPTRLGDFFPQSMLGFGET